MRLTSPNQSAVDNFYQGKSVFITGATGFLGKMLVEKLLYECSGIEKIYILIRPKKGATLNERVQKLVDSPVFQRLKDVRPEDLSKIVPVAGDLTAPGLGLETKDEQILLENVSVVFHSAATVSFDEPLRAALAVNLEGTVKVLDLCKRMRNIQIFVHVSTAYSNTDRKVLEERVYPPPAEIDDVYKFVQQHGDDEKAVAKILNGLPNTYCFSKALSETYVARYHGDIPTVILRPSIVTATVKEPVEGWIEGWQGFTFALATSARGFLRVMMSDRDGVAGLIPADHVVNMAVISAVFSKKDGVSVYNCCTSGVNPISWYPAAKQFTNAGKADNFHKLPYPGIYPTLSRTVMVILTLFLQTIPAYILDAWRIMKGNRAMYVKLNRKINNAREKFHYFTTRSWNMRSDAAAALATALSDEDATRFPCHPAQVHWPSYIPIYYRGVKKYLIGEK